LSRLVIARETVDEVLSDGAEASSAMPERAAPSRFGHLSPIGVLVVPPRTGWVEPITRLHPDNTSRRYST
jgi:hypothetical protein